MGLMGSVRRGVAPWQLPDSCTWMANVATTSGKRAAGYRTPVWETIITVNEMTIRPIDTQSVQASSCFGAPVEEN